MYRRYLTLAGTVAFGSATLFVMSGCSSRSPQPSNQAYSTTTYMTSQGAPVYSSDDAWQRGSNPGPAPKASQPVVEAAGSEAQTQQAQVQTQTRQAAPRNSNAQSQSDDSWKLESPRASDTAPHADVPAYDQRARNQSQSSSSSARRSTSSAPMMATTPMITEGSNSGGQWNPGLTEGTRGPEVSSQQGWVPGYYNPDFHQQPTTIRESAGSSTGNLQQQLNEQQRQLNQQQKQINQQQRELQRLHQQKQQAPSDNSTSQ